MNATPLVIAAFVLMVLGVPAIVGAIRARWIEESIGLEQRKNRVLAEIDLEDWEREIGDER